MRDRTPGSCTGLCAALLLIAVSLNAATKTDNRVAAGQTTQPSTGAATAVFPDNRVLVIGGNGPYGPLSAVELYAGGFFSTVAAMNSPRSGHAAAMLHDSSVLVTGGRTLGGEASSSAELYDPKSDRWSIIGDMAKARAGHTATLLSDGRVLIAGGESAGTVTDTLEIFNPATKSFSTVRSMLSTPRTNHAAALLRDGRAMIIGGSDGSKALASIDIFDPLLILSLRDPRLSWRELDTLQRLCPAGLFWS